MKILYIHIEEFYLTIERSRKKISDGPIVIHFPEEPGFVVTASTDAKAHGIRPQMTLEKAQAALPGGTFIPADFQTYSQISESLNTALRDLYPFTEQIDFYAWFSDITDHDDADIRDILRRRLCVMHPFQISHCISENKFLAKLGVDTGQAFDSPEINRRLAETSLDHFWGVPRKYITELRNMGLANIGDLTRVETKTLEAKFPRVANRLLQLANGRDDYQVQPFSKPSKLSRSGRIRMTDSDADKRKFLAKLSDELGVHLARTGYVAFALHMDIIGDGQKLSNRYRFLLPTIRPSSILVGATSLFKKMRDMLPATGSVEVTLSVNDIVYNREQYQLHGAPPADIELMTE